MTNNLNLKEIENLNKELLKLKYNEKPKIIEEIKKAKLFGDLSENSEYHSAKKKKILIENKIKEIEKKISICKVTNKKTKNKKIILKNIKNNKIIKYEINEKSNNQKFFKEIINNKNINDIVEIERYNKKLKFKIILIE